MGYMIYLLIGLIIYTVLLAIDPNYSFNKLGILKFTMGFLITVALWPLWSVVIIFYVLFKIRRSLDGV